MKYSPKNIQTLTFKIIILVTKTTKEQNQRSNQEIFPEVLHPNHIETKSEAPLTLGLSAQGRNPGPRLASGHRHLGCPQSQKHYAVKVFTITGLQARMI